MCDVHEKNMKQSKERKAQYTFEDKVSTTDLSEQETLKAQ